MIRSSRREAGRTTARAAFTLLVTALAFWFLYRTLGDVGLARLWDRIVHAERWLLVAALAVTALRFLLLGVRWEILLRGETRVGLSHVLPVLMAGNFLSLVTPAVRVAGPILRAWYLSQETGKPRARFYGTIVADQASNFTVYGVAAILGGAMVSLPPRFRVSPAMGAALLAALVIGLWVASILLRQVHHGEPSRAVRLLERFAAGAAPGWRSRMLAWVDHLVRSLSGSVVGGGAWWPSLALSAAIFAAVAAVQMMAFHAIGAPLTFIQAVFAVAGAGFIQILAAAPGGVGVTEASLIAVLGAMGADPESAAVGALLARFANYAILLPWGGWAFVRLQRRYGMPARGEQMPA